MVVGRCLAQIDFQFPANPVWPVGGGPLLLVSKGSFDQGTGWEVQINNVAYQGKYQIPVESNHGVGSYNFVTSYQIVPDAFNRALLICDRNGDGNWYVNGSPWSSQPCLPPSSGATDLTIGRYSRPASASRQTFRLAESKSGIGL